MRTRAGNDFWWRMPDGGRRTRVDALRSRRWPMGVRVASRRAPSIDDRTRPRHLSHRPLYPSISPHGSLHSSLPFFIHAFTVRPIQRVPVFEIDTRRRGRGLDQPSLIAATSRKSAAASQGKGTRNVCHKSGSAISISMETLCILLPLHVAALVFANHFRHMPYVLPLQHNEQYYTSASAAYANAHMPNTSIHKRLHSPHVSIAHMEVRAKAATAHANACTCVQRCQWLCRR